MTNHEPPGPGSLLPATEIDRLILTIRTRKVMLDTDLAGLYGVEPRAPVQAVKRNIGRFPADFAFQLGREEFAVLKSESVISNGQGRGGRRTPNHVFTEQGVAMLSSLLRSERAVRVNNEIMWTFVRLRRLSACHEELVRRLNRLERRSDVRYRAIFRAIRKMMQTVSGERRPIGFRSRAES